MTGGNRTSARLGSVAAVFFTALTLAMTDAATVETNNASTATDAALMHQIVRSYEQLQEQQQSVLRALDQARQDAESIAKRNNDAVESRLHRIEDSVNVQRQRELDSLQQS